MLEMDTLFAYDFAEIVTGILSSFSKSFMSATALKSDGESFSMIERFAVTLKLTVLTPSFISYSLPAFFNTSALVTVTTEVNVLVCVGSSIFTTTSHNKKAKTKAKIFSPTSLVRAFNIFCFITIPPSFLAR